MDVALRERTIPIYYLLSILDNNKMKTKKEKHRYLIKEYLKIIKICFHSIPWPVNQDRGKE